MGRGDDRKDARKRSVMPAKAGAQANSKQQWIASQLRRVYDEALQEEIPNSMMALLAKLDEKKDKGDPE